MRTTPRALRPHGASRQGGPALPGTPLSQVHSPLSQAAVGSAPSPLPLSLVDAWDASMTHHQTSPRASPTPLLMGPRSPNSPSSTLPSPDRPLEHSPGKFGVQRSNPSHAGLWSSLPDEGDSDAVLADEHSMASDDGSSPRFQCHHASCPQSSASNSPVRHSLSPATIQSGTLSRSQSVHHASSAGSPDQHSAASSPDRSCRSTATHHEGSQSERGPPCILTHSPLRPSHAPRNAASLDSTSALERGLTSQQAEANSSNSHATRPTPSQSMSTDRRNTSLIERSFVISEGQRLAASTSIAPRDPAFATEGTIDLVTTPRSAKGSPAAELSKQSTRPHQSHEDISLSSSSSPLLANRRSVGSDPSLQPSHGSETTQQSPAAISMPSFRLQEELPVGSPLSRASSGPLAGCPILAGSTSTASPSDLSSPESGMVRAQDEFDSPTQSALAYRDEHSSHATSPYDQKGHEDIADASENGSEEVQEELRVLDNEDGFRIGAVHSSPAKKDPVQWRSGISTLHSHHRGSSSEPSSPMGGPMTSFNSPQTGSNPARPRSSSPAKTPWTMYKTPDAGVSEGMFAPSSKHNLSGELRTCTDTCTWVRAL